MLLEGLEISEVRFSKVDLGDRFDAEYFAQTDIEIEDRLKAESATELRAFGDFVASAFYPAAVHLYEKGDVPFIRCVDCVNYPLITTYQDTSFEKIPLDFAVESKGINFLNKGEIVITKVGTPSYASMVFEHEQVALSRTVLGIKNIRGIDPHYLLIFLRSRYGFSQLQRNRELTIQYQLTLERVKKTLVFIPSAKFQKSIASFCIKFEDALTEARQIYEQAEKLLLDTLDMVNFSPSAEAINIKSFKDSFSATGRLDAEYYQPKYEDYQAHVLAYQNGWQLLMQACNLKDRNFTPDDATAYKYIELANIDISGGITGCTEEIGKELPSRARRMVSVNDVLISSIEGSLPSCAIVPERMNGALCSTGFYVINSESINSETLLVLFKSPLMQNLLKQGCSGTILTAINKTEFHNIPVPMIEDGTQKKIAVLIKESFSLKMESERLLEVAKRSVEIAIEQDESAGMAYIEENL